MLTLSYIIDNTQNIILDSRKAIKNGIFFTLPGNQTHGEHFIDDVLDIGGFVVTEKNIKHPNVLIVDNVINTLQFIAQQHRLKFNIPIIAITGSNGKTTVKDMLHAILKEEIGAEHLLATSGNLNNHLGVPLTLFKLNSKHKIAILEMGMSHSGEMSVLSKMVRPTIAIITNIAYAHSSHFSSIREIACAKKEILDGLHLDGVCFLPQSEWLPLLSENVMQMIQVVDINKIHQSQVTNQRVILERLYHNKSNAFTCPIPGDAILYNMNLVIDVCEYLNISLSSVKDALSQFTTDQKRMFVTHHDNMIILNDCYNANKESMLNALHVLSLQNKNKIAILGEMAELGSWSRQHHKDVLEYAHTIVDSLYLYGPEINSIAKELNIPHISIVTPDDLYLFKDELLNSAILIKGSRSARMEHFSNILTSLN